MAPWKARFIPDENKIAKRMQQNGSEWINQGWNLAFHEEDELEGVIPIDSYWC